MYYDTPIGVLCLESHFPKPKGHLRNPRTFDFPVVCSVVSGIDVSRLLFNPTSELVQPFVDAAIELECHGVKAITGSCGFLARYQYTIAEQVTIPVFLSSLVQIPLVRILHGRSAKIGLLTASASALKAEHFENTGSDIEEVHIKGMEGNPEFWETIIEGKRHDFDMTRLETEICNTAKALTKEHRLDALILECTDLSAFSKPIQDAVEIPIYDINSLVEYVNYSVSRTNYGR